MLEMPDSRKRAQSQRTLRRTSGIQMFILTVCTFAAAKHSMITVPVSKSFQAAITKIPHTEWLQQQTFVSCSSGS